MGIRVMVRMNSAIMPQAAARPKCLIGGISLRESDTNPIAVVKLVKKQGIHSRFRVCFITSGTGLSILSCFKKSVNK